MSALPAALDDAVRSEPQIIILTKEWALPAAIGNREPRHPETQINRTSEPLVNWSGAAAPTSTRFPAEFPPRD